MNFLAHLHLSKHDDQLMLGNFIADSVKGSAWKEYEEPVREGILMHRRIDDFTDKHPVFRETVELLRPRFRKFAGVVADIYYDHFLAKDYSEYSQESLVEFTRRIHLLLQSSEHMMPVRSVFFLQYMLAKNIPLPYAEPEGIRMVLIGMSRRSSAENSMQDGGKVLLEMYETLQDQFRRFYPDAIKEFAR